MPSYFTTLATAATLAVLASAQSSSPTPTSTGSGAAQTSNLPFLFPFGASLGASIASANNDQTVLALSCLDKSGCPNPSTASYTFGRSTIAFNYPGGAFSCPVTSDTVTCTLSAEGSTNSNVYPLTMLAPERLPPTEGIAQAVTITGSGASPSSTGSSSGSGSGSGSSSGMPMATGSSSSGSSAAASPSASHTSNSAEHLAAGTGLLGAVALLVGAVIA